MLLAGAVSSGACVLAVEPAACMLADRWRRLVVGGVPAAGAVALPFVHALGLWLASAAVGHGFRRAGHDE